MSKLNQNVDYTIYCFLHQHKRKIQCQLLFNPKATTQSALLQINLITITNIQKKKKTPTNHQPDRRFGSTLDEKSVDLLSFRDVYFTDVQIYHSHLWI